MLEENACFLVRARGGLFSVAVRVARRARDGCVFMVGFI